MTPSAVVALDERLRQFVVAALLYGKREMARNGVYPPQEFDALVDALAVRSGPERSLVGQATDIGEPVTVSYAEAARRLGVSLSTVRRAVAAGQLPCVSVGRRRLIPTAALDELANGRREAS